jgi:ABC-type lipoprotein release transport system permease subunit
MPEIKNRLSNKAKATLKNNKTKIVVGTALAVSIGANVLLFKEVTAPNRFKLSSDDIAYLNHLLETDQAL